MGTKMLYFEGNGGNKSLPAREGTLDKVSRSWDGDDHHQSWKVRRQIMGGKKYIYRYYDWKLLMRARWVLTAHTIHNARVLFIITQQGCLARF